MEGCQSGETVTPRKALYDGAGAVARVEPGRDQALGTFSASDSVQMQVWDLV